MNQPLVTVVTIVKNLLKNNREHTFKQCVDSVLKQQYPHIEHLVVDGASTDGTVPLLKIYEEGHYLHFISSPDTGIYDAMNKGVTNAKGEYIVFLNSDDYFENPEAVSRSIAALENSNADFSFGTVDMINDKQTLTFYPFEPYFICTMPFSHQSMFCRRSVLLKYKFDTKFRLAGDIDLIQRLYLDGLTSVDTRWKISVYRMTGDSSNNQNACYKEYAKVFQKNYSKFCHYSLDSFEYFARTFQLPSKLLRAVKRHIMSKNRAMGERLFNTGVFQISNPGTEGVKGIVRKLLPESAFNLLRNRIIDYIDKGVDTKDYTLYFMNMIPVLKVQKGIQLQNFLKISLFGIVIYKRKNVFM